MSLTRDEIRELIYEDPDFLYEATRPVDQELFHKILEVIADELELETSEIKDKLLNDHILYELIHYDNILLYAFDRPDLIRRILKKYNVVTFFDLEIEQAIRENKPEILDILLDYIDNDYTVLYTMLESARRKEYGILHHLVNRYKGLLESEKFEKFEESDKIKDAIRALKQFKTYSKHRKLPEEIEGMILNEYLFGNNLSYNKMPRRFSRRRRFGSTKYQKEVNSLAGAMGPTNSAVWNTYTTTTGNPTSLGAQPLYYNPAIGKYVTSYAEAAGPASINIFPSGTANFSSSFGKRRRRRRFVKRRSRGKNFRRKFSKRQSRSRKRRSRGKRRSRFGKRRRSRSKRNCGPGKRRSRKTKRCRSNKMNRYRC